MFESEFEESIIDDTLQKHKDLLKVLPMDSRIMCVCKDNKNNEFYLEECCDNWFRHTLTKIECIELSELFKEIANKL